MKSIVPFLASLAAASLIAVSCGKGDSAAGADAAGEPRRAASMGVAFAVGGRDDASLNHAAYEGLLAFARDSGARIEGDPDADYGDALSIRVLESVHGEADRSQLLRSLAEQGSGLVVAVGFLFSDSIGAIAREYPAVRFALVDGFVPDLKPGSNLACIGFAEHEGSFLVGAYAGRVASRSGADARVGFVGGMDSPSVRRYHAGFAAGAAYANPDLRVAGRILSSFVSRDSSGFSDAKRAGELASVLYQQGRAAVIFNAAGAAGVGVFEAAARLGAKAIGSDADQGALLAASREGAALSKVVATSMVKRVDRAVYALGRELLAEAPWSGGYRTFGLAEGGVGYATALLDPDDLAYLSDLSRRIAARELFVPDDEEELGRFLEALRP